jgi:cytochrome c-type biogenesis protein CcmH/NrfG
MNVRLAIAACGCAGLMMSYGRPVVAQVDVHAHAVARASCQSGKHSDTVTDAKTAMEHNPDDLGPRLRMADTLVDQGCYQEAVEILEAAEAAFPRNAELNGKMRDVRSLVTEQTYIEGLTQAAEGAKLARNQLRCTRLSDIAACEDALRSKPDDAPLLLAKGDALMQANRPADAVTAYHHVTQLRPGDDSVKTKLAAAEALIAKTQPPAPPPAVAANTAGPKAPKAPRKAPAVVAANRPTPPAKDTAPQLNGGQRLTATPTAAVAALSPTETKTYSNDAQPGQTN